MKKNKPGRPMTNIIEPIPASMEEIAKAICRDADTKVQPKSSSNQSP